MIGMKLAAVVVVLWLLYCWALDDDPRDRKWFAGLAVGTAAAGWAA